MGLYQIVLITPKFLSEDFTLTIVEMQSVPDIERTDSKE